MEACEGTQEGAQLNHTRDMVSEAVGACTGCLPGILYSHLFGSDDDQHMVAVMEIRHRRDMQGILAGLAQAFSSGGQYAIEVIAGANEGGGEDRTWIVINLLGMVELLNLAFGHDGYAVGDGKGFFLVVSDVDGGHLELLLNAADLVTQRDAHLGIQGGERLVEQEHFGFDGQCASQSNALLLASGELVWIAAAFVAQPDEFE